ncbi:TonB-dependent receptor [Scleromatobacter humisilvae]|uniref:TonB-dependent receptor n=1 Tax=Scleromatobacter humisilvae TaxID=2897159 RepID=A0A9X2C095_9BURK|nr:TonB-dependent receptor [Scleromatobacter humisilvae]MCK9687498.1 TonB-dependent receptor [Scleromatobacter humisilvae]
MHTSVPHRLDRSAPAIAAATLCAFMQLAHGQAAAPAAAASAPASDSSESETVQKVIVTANKREQAALDVAASVSAIGAERLTLSGATRLEDFAAQIPGLSIIEVTRGQMAVVLRGISTGALQSTPTTAQYVDEAPVGSVNAYAEGAVITPDLDPSDLQRVEVLKGPQGTLYGAGAVGGLLRYVTAPADTERFFGVVTLGANKVSEGGVGSNERVALNVPLAKDVLGLRVSAFERTEAGYIDNPVDGRRNGNTARTRGGRVALDCKLDPDWAVRVWALTQKLKADGYGSEDVLAPSLAPLTGDLQRSTWTPEPQTMSLDLANASVKGRLGSFELVSSTTWQDTESRMATDTSRANTAILQFIFKVPGLGVQTDGLIKTRRISQELRARSSAFDDTLDFDLGVFGTKEDSSYLITAGSPFLMATGQVFPSPPLADLDIGSKYQEVSVFGNATWAVSPTFDLLGGLRLSSDKQRFDQDDVPTIAAPVAAMVTQDVAQKHTTWMLGARYKPTPDSAVYVRAASAYRPGGPSALPPGILPDGKASFTPDNLISYEAGYKSEFLSGKASIEAAVFATDWKNIQLRTSAQGPTIAYAYFINGGTAQSNGAEVTLVWVPASGLTLRANGAYTDAHLTSDAPAAGGVAGDAMPYTPKWSASTGGDYNFALGAHKAWVGATVNFIGSRRSDFSQHLPVNLPSYTTLNANAGMDIAQARVSLYVRNISDRRGINYAAPAGDQTTGLNPSGNPFSATVIQPRTFGVDLAYRF